VSCLPVNAALCAGADVAEVMLLTTARRGEVHAHVLCKSVSAIHSIDELSITGQFAHLLRNAFADLMDVAETVAVSQVVWQPADYLACVRYFHIKLGERANTHTEKVIHTHAHTSRHGLGDSIYSRVIVIVLRGSQ